MHSTFTQQQKQINNTDPYDFKAKAKTSYQCDWFYPHLDHG